LFQNLQRRLISDLSLFPEDDDDQDQEEAEDERTAFPPMLRNIRVGMSTVVPSIVR
jgi:hypothetical protein